ncbi:glycoside hydrolase family 97 catalytic domain-containing protein [Luteolibacter ambystomatis]|uniref:Glycoside hydrolase family 97 catalytic domain-containing protein n=1 Tax=Luteolibacter ambystomatis TaxID=2824561 RepID=A0A975G5V0_9BACT|nr:glycoside hydrolase family 97 catalytic domain-containing protein [Luteolibacter ambystomatis]QUE49518.1 glycoside hydrolase family 97 catalytic domain-containing protein [Luteolibacter ambystomatis]
MSKGSLIIFAWMAAAASACGAFVTERTIASPGGGVVFTLERDTTTGALLHSVTSAGRVVVTRGTFGLDLGSTIGIVASQGALGDVQAADVDLTWSNPFGEEMNVRDRCRQETLSIVPSVTGQPDAKIQVRAYDTGIAWRYLISGSGTVASEKSTFPMPSSTVVWTSTSAQGTISKQSLSVASGSLDRPVLAQLASDLYASLGEAGLVDGARMKFTRTGTSTLSASLSSSEAFTGLFTSPWRYVRVGSSPAALLQDSAFMLNLNEPSKVADTSWIQPGKVLREVTLTTQGGLACIDFAAAHDLRYILFDAGWYGPENSSSSDATTVNVDPARSPGPLDLPAVIAYGKQKGVGVILYVNQIALTRQLDQILPLYESWGVAGMKFGFVNVGSQSNTTWLHNAVAKCADHHLIVDIHDEYRPTGVSRTWPNLLTQEGIRGDEETPKNADALKSLFTRCLAGASDQTNCYFASRVATMGSHASQLAKSVCIFSPWQTLYWYDRPAGSPGSAGAGGGVSVLQEVPELSFFDRLPTTWDESRILDGHPDTHVTVARRKGTTWFLAGLNGNTARTFQVPLTFLDSTKAYRAEVFRDDGSVATTTQVAIDMLDVDAGATLVRSVAAGNGFTVILTENGLREVVPPTPPLSSMIFKKGTSPGSSDGLVHLSNYQGVQDTSLVQETPGNNYGGRDTLLVGVLGSGKVRSGLTRFDLSVLGGRYASIKSMTLRLRVAAVTDLSASCQVGVQLEREGNSGWVEGSANGAAVSGTSCWNHAASTAGAWLGGTAGARTATDCYAQLGSATLDSSIAPVGAWIEIPLSAPSGVSTRDSLTKIVDSWIAGGGSGNAGLLLTYGAPYTGAPQWQFASSDHTNADWHPELIVEYFPADPYGQWVALKGIPIASAGTDDDPDGDGIPNAIECVLGTNPLVRDDSTKLPTLTMDVNGLRYSYRLSATGPFLQPQVQYSTTLDDWQSLVSGQFGAAFNEGARDANGVSTVDVSLEQPPAGKMFFRIAVP